MALDMSKLTVADTQDEVFSSVPATGHMMQISQSASLSQDHDTLMGEEVTEQPQRSSSDTVLLALDKPEAYVPSSESSESVGGTLPAPIRPASSPIAIEVSVAFT